MPGRLLGTLIAAAGVGAAAFAANKAVKNIKEKQEKEAEEKARAIEWGDRQIYIVGAGISGLSAAAYLVRDCGMNGANIHIISGSGKVGGIFARTDGGYIADNAFISANTSENLMELLGSVPSVDAPQRSAAEEIANYSAAHPVKAKARMIVGSGEISELSSMQLDGNDRSQMIKLIFADEKTITDLRIDQWFAEHFFTTDFWYLWQTAYGIRRWDSLAELRRQIRRNAASLGDLDSLADRINTPFDIYDSVIVPLKAYLDRAGVLFELDDGVSDIEFTEAMIAGEYDEDEEEDGEEENEEAEAEDGIDADCEEKDADIADDEAAPESADTAEDRSDVAAADDTVSEEVSDAEETVEESAEAPEAAGTESESIPETSEESETESASADETAEADEQTVSEENSVSAEDIASDAPAVSEPEAESEECCDNNAGCEDADNCCEGESCCGCDCEDKNEECCEGCSEADCEGCEGCGDPDSDIVIIPTAILLDSGKRIDLGEDDICILTLGVGSDSVMIGSSDKAAYDESALADRQASLWELLSSDCPELGDAERYFADPKGSAVESFTFVMNGNKLLKLFENLTGNVAGSGGLITLRDSGWLLSLTVPAQPVYKSQADGTTVIYGYGLYTESAGTYVKKPMKDATGLEILYEIICQLQWADRWEEIKETVISAIPVYSPFAASHLLPRSADSRPDVIPEGTINLAVIGSFADVPSDTSGTIEYAVRSARSAVYRIAETKLEPIPVPNDLLKPDKILKALQILFK